MKSICEFIITTLLSFRARQLIKRHRTQVIAITGSVGKTSAKEAIYCILKDHFKTYAGAQGFNTDLGVSLTILQEEQSGFSSPWEWAKIIYRAFFSEKKHYQKIVLEMGANRPGDIRRLLKIVKPKIGVITNVSPTHLDKENGQFEDLTATAKEKNTLIQEMSVSDVAILNYHDPLVRTMQTNAQKIYYGLESNAQVRAVNIRVGMRNLNFTVSYKNSKSAFAVPVIGRFQVDILLPAIAAALQLGISLEECAKSLSHFKLPPGRLNLLSGLSKSHILDSSYNASPASMKAALEVLKELPAERKIAALGSMNELGKMSEEAHLNTGILAAECGDILIAVGNLSHIYKRGALSGGMKEANIYTFLNSEEAGLFAKNLLKPKDLILVKGSQNRVRMERFTKAILAYPESAKQVLCRQEHIWNGI